MTGTPKGSLKWFMEKPGIEPATPGLQDRFIPYLEIILYIDLLKFAFTGTKLSRGMNNVVSATSKGPDQPALSLCWSLEYSMTVKLLTKHHLEFLSLKKAALARLSLHLSKYHIVGINMSWLNN